MKRVLHIIMILLACTHMRAQEAVYYNEQNEQTAEKQQTSTDTWNNTQREDVLQLIYSGQWLQDSYLSPLVYDGWYAGLNNEWWTCFKRQPESQNGSRWRHMGSLQATGGKLIQSRKHNAITTFDIQAGWGAHPYWTLHTPVNKSLKTSRFELYAGPYLGLDFMMKNISSNVNKPYSFDAGIDIELMAGASYTFGFRKTAYRLLYEGRINAIGAMWLPDYGESYYEITEMILDGSVHFSYPGNRQFIHQQLAMDFQFRRSTWRLGVKHEYLHYGDRNKHFARQSVGLSVGCIFNYSVSGTKL